MDASGLWNLVCRSLDIEGHERAARVAFYLMIDTLNSINHECSFSNRFRIWHTHEECCLVEYYMVLTSGILYIALCT